MERYAMFIDAGYLLAEAGDLLFDTLAPTGTKIRPSCDYKKLLSRLERFACKHCELPILRIYWYDGAPNGFPTFEHKGIAKLPNVKLRLGRMVGGKQKGVDALIYRDLMTLSQEHAITTGYLLSGDEDLREGVIAAQDMGVRIILLGVPSRRKPNQSNFLVREADEHIMVEKEILEPYFSRSDEEILTVTNEDIDKAKKVGQEFADRWVEDATSEQIHQLRHQSPQIPPAIDLELLKEAQRTFGSLEGREKRKWTLKRSLREGFWDAVRAAREISDSTP